VTAPTPVIFLHIGAMKTGTTFLQTLMHENKENLAAAGYLLPGERWVHEVRAVQDVLGGGPGYPAAAPNTAGEWKALARRMIDHDGVASILSMEFLSLADPKRARRVLRSLQPAEVHVILTVRDATATIQAQWQTTVRNNSRVSWPDFMAGIRRAGGIEGRFGRFSWNRALRSFMRAQDVEYMLDTWGRYLPAERIHVVTVPSGSDRTVLWDRFAGVLGIDPGVCSELPEEANESLGYASTELIRRINMELGRLPHTEYNPTILDFLAIPVLAGRREQETTARLDRATFEFGLAWNRRIRQAILAAGVELVGDIEELPVADVALGRAIEEDQAPPSADEILAAATVAEEAMRQLITRRIRRLRKQDVAVDPGDGAQRVHLVGPESWTHAPDPVTAAVKDIAALSRRAIDLNNRLRELRLRTSR